MNAYHSLNKLNVKQNVPKTGPIVMTSYDQYASNAEKKGENLQKPIKNMCGDTVFFTQPMVANNLGSQAFARKRERIYQYKRGFDECHKSEYFRDRAKIARETANGAKYQNVAYLDRQIKECKKEIKDRKKNLINYENTLYDIENGVQKTGYGGEPIIAENVMNWIELIEKTMDNQAFLESCFAEYGGVPFNKTA